ncbi:nuclear pore complex protein NUP1 [Lycium barbarum]|uniref:nuclear pore complex protein NUP1 n=1 Tax=Lycium barbarum TaxID=112863 RepID=UPI00293EDCD2|nr:nuclear pore complex protein NUP1 [Lycium barbarum]
MSTARDGTGAAGAYEGAGTGAGGKFRKKPFRRNQTTPYDRPPPAQRNPSWLTKAVVDPASKLITNGAQRLFNSLFRKHLEPSTSMPLSLPPGPRQEPPNLPQESRPNEYAGALVEAGQGGDNDARSSGDGAFSELEQLLKQKTFTRTEIDRLTELLRSKAVDMPMGDEEKRAEAIQSRCALDSSSSLLEENNSVKVTSGGVVATPVMNSRILEDDIASPAELAKAYMGSRPSKVSPSMLSTRSQVVREDTPLLTNAQYVQRSPVPSVTTRTPGFLGVRENGFTTPRSRGRSAIYSMARTPYSRVRQTDVQKATSSANYDYGGSSSSKPVSEHDILFGSKQALKRRSYVLDDDLGSVGPMRRIRQKPNLSFGASRLSTRVASAANLHPEVSKVVGDVEDNKTTPARHVAIPPKSSETAAKILEQLEKITPKGKSSESKLAAGKENKLTPNMLHGRALRSLEDLDSPKLLQSAQNSYKLENWSKILSPNPSESRQSEFKRNGHKSSVSESTVIAKKDTIFSFKDTQPNVETNSLEKNKSAAQPPLKKRAFKMSAYEDSFELEEDINSNGPSSQLAEGRGKLEISAADQKPLCAAEPTSKPAALLDVKTPPGVLDKRSDMETPDTGAVAVTASNKTKETNVDMVPPFLFSSSTPVTGSKPGSSSSLSNLAFGRADGRPNPFQLDNSQKAVDSNGKLEALSSGPSSSMSTSGILSFGAPSSPSSNGLFPPSPAISATSALASGSFTNEVSTSSSNVGAPLTSITSTIGGTTGSSTASASSLFGSSAASSFSKEPLIKFGFSGVPPKTVSAPATISTAETTDMNAKSESGTAFGNLKSSPFGGASFAATGFGSVMSTGTAGSTESQGSVFSTGGASLVSAQTSVGGSGISAVSGSMPAPFSSSASLPSTANFPVFGSAPGTTGQVSASPSNNALVGSSNAASGIFSFGASSSSSSAAGCSSGPTNGTVALAFTFGASSAAPSKTSVPATSSSATPGIFSFSGSSSASSTNAVNISSSTTPSVFNFGGNTSSSSANTINTSAAPGIFNIGGSSSTSPANAGNTSTSASPGIFSFGASSSASLTNAASTVNPSPFHFGATSASSQASSTAGTFGSSWQPQKSPGFTSSFSSSTPSVFTFGASSSSFTTPSTSPVVFGSTPSAASGSAFLFGSTSSTNSLSQPMFGNSAFAASPGNNVNMEDSMAEDVVQAPAPAVSFGQPSVSPSPGGSAFGSAPSPFQFGGQQSQAAPQNPNPFAASSLVQPAPQNSSPFVASNSLEFGGGGSFSLGSSGPDKSGRKIVKINRNKHKRK